MPRRPRRPGWQRHLIRAARLSLLLGVVLGLYGLRGTFVSWVMGGKGAKGGGGLVADLGDLHLRMKGQKALEDSIDLGGSPPAAPADPPGVATAQTPAAAAPAESPPKAPGVGEVGDDDAGKRGRRLSTLLALAEKAAGADNIVIVTAASIKEKDLLANWLLHMAENGSLAQCIVLAFDESILKLLQEAGVAVFDARDPRMDHSKLGTPIKASSAEGLRVQQGLLVNGYEVVWTDVDCVWLSNLAAPDSYLRAIRRAHIVARNGGERDQARPLVRANADGDGKVFTGLVYTVNNGKTMRNIGDVYKEVLGGKEPQAAYNAILREAKAGVMAGNGTKGHMDAPRGLTNNDLVVRVLPTYAFPLVGAMDSREGWEAAKAGGAEIFQRSVGDPGEKKAAMVEAGVYWVRKGWDNAPRGGDAYTWLCGILDLHVHVGDERHAHAVSACKKGGQLGKLSADEREREKRDKERVAAEEAAVRREKMYEGNKPLQEKVPVVMQLSQGRAGSTVTGDLMLHTHPYCGLYLDELVWGIHRTKMCTRVGDQAPLYDTYFKTSQCQFQMGLWGKHQNVYKLAQWLSKRDKYGLGHDKGKDLEWFKVDNIAPICSSLRDTEPKRAVCTKELGFLGEVDRLLEEAAAREIPFTLVYLLRDPRATVISQLGAFESWTPVFDIDTPTADTLRDHCRIAVKDLQAMAAHKARRVGIETVEICFESFNREPKEALRRAYGNMSAFSTWATDMSDEPMIPKGVAEYGCEHMANWGPECEDKKTEEGRVGGRARHDEQATSIAHRYSTDKTRSKAISQWMNDYAKDKSMIDVWEGFDDCKTLKRISQCTTDWPHIPHNPNAGPGALLPSLWTVHPGALS